MLTCKRCFKAKGFSFIFCLQNSIMDTQTYSRLLSYVVCEITMPVKKHVYNFAISDQTLMNRQILSAAALTVESQTLKGSAYSEQVSSNLRNSSDIEMSSLQKETATNVNNEVEELCEGTEIEKSALEDILNYENCEQIMDGRKMSTDISTSVDQDSEVLAVVEKNSNINQQPEPKRRRYSSREEIPLQSISIEVEDGVSDTLTSSIPCLEGNECVLVNENDSMGGKDSVQYSDPALLCTDSDFKNMFRVSRSTFQILVEILSEEDVPIEDVPLYKKVLIVLWLLGTSQSHSDAAQKFGVSEEAVTSCFYDVCATLYNKSENFIKWPSFGESDEIASRIEKNFGFPGVVGVLGCHYFTISIPKETFSRREHFNGKLRMYCVALQLVCDDEFVIRDVFPGMPGGVRPTQILRDSPIGELLTTQPTELIDPNKHILARSEFPQLASMLTPYTENSELLTNDKEEFNALHENVCLLVDQTFQTLKSRFRVLNLLDPEIATMVLVTCCVLHNICIQSGDTYDLEITA